MSNGIGPKLADGWRAVYGTWVPQPQYLCQWRDREYSECTWETNDTVLISLPIVPATPHTMLACAQIDKFSPSVTAFRAAVDAYYARTEPTTHVERTKAERRVRFCKKSVGMPPTGIVRAGSSLTTVTGNPQALFADLALSAQPASVTNGQLRDYQIAGVRWLVKAW